MEAMNPLIHTAGQKATIAGSQIKENILNPLGSYFGKAKEQLQEAYAANVAKHQMAKQAAYG